MSRPSCKVSVIVPARNEEDHIAACLRSLLDQETGHSFEIIVVDGNSSDATVKLAMDHVSDTPPLVRILDNPAKTAPHALNIGILHASGDMIIRLDGHAIAPRNFIDDLVGALLDHPGAACAGPCIETVGQGKWGKAIAAVLSDPIGVGTSRFRTGSLGEIRRVDTVPFGAYRAGVFSAVGNFDTSLTRNQDDEFNGRLTRNGYAVLLVPTVSVEYRCRASLKAFARQYYDYGRFKPLVAARLGRPTSVRQFAPPLLVAGLASTPLAVWVWGPKMLSAAGLYVCLIVFRGFQRRRDALPFRFAVAGLVGHVSYGVGYWFGLAKLRKALWVRAGKGRIRFE